MRDDEIERFLHEDCASWGTIDAEAAARCSPKAQKWGCIGPKAIWLLLSYGLVTSIGVVF